MNLQDDPNYLIISTDEYVQAAHPVSDRTGVLLGITAVLGTTLILLNSGADLAISQRIYQYFLPVTFMAISFALYASSLVKNMTAMPYKYLHNKALEDSITLTDPATSLPSLQEGLERAKTAYKLKAKLMQWGTSFFIISILIVALVNLITYHTLEVYLHSNPILVSVLLSIVGVLGACLLKAKLFDTKTFPFNHQIQVRRNVSPATTHAAQGMPQNLQVSYRAVPIGQTPPVPEQVTTQQAEIPATP